MTAINVSKSRQKKVNGAFCNASMYQKRKPAIIRVVEYWFHRSIPIAKGIYANVAIPGIRIENGQKLTGGNQSPIA
ncbi:hypothetical protein SpiGrapes_1001 [Sphaerochaeta pleomorpha str. Grapes]|uniref:Uncharacterized protein n=1 Tax=Sphaerochaeta pleomorpha (strain ATCC BAA-1885 / DSM 22778 / Grapes) TaxID=158190 RepID=G8QRP3_SPHPG|nr:hypothetical protein [Sphaerochaeta pleomorpha]AEV28826.1 hypothetical protein SpiGrapes_1001 [Sphaerochaeta pleomorpha str. Grapes]